MKLFTFCVDIGRHSRNDLENILRNVLLKSLSKRVHKFQLVVFSNFNMEIDDNRVILNNYFDLDENYYDDKWLNLSYNKINIWKYLYDKTGENYTWIDLDTVVVYDISYFNDVDHLFIENGGYSRRKWPLTHNTQEAVTFSRYIQGNIWKLNINLYNDLIKTFKKTQELGIKFKFDLQDLYNYYCYFNSEDKNSSEFDEKAIINTDINILGYTYKLNVIAGLSVWGESGETQAELSGLDKMFVDIHKECPILRTNFYPDKEIHILSFTFFTLKNLLNSSTLDKIINNIT